MRTSQQNRAMHKYFRLLAEELNDAGYDMKSTLNEDREIPWTEENVKNHLWRPIQEAMLSKESTMDLETKEVNQVYEVLNRHLGEKLGISVMFPVEDRDGY